MEYNHTMSTISQFKLDKHLNTTVDFEISLPSDKGNVPAIWSHQLCNPSRQHQSQRLRTVGESETHFGETNHESRFISHPLY